MAPTVMSYLQSKGLTSKQRNKRAPAGEAAITEPQWRQLLEAAEASKDRFNRHWKRDYAAIFLGYLFALRLGECVVLERKHFETLEKHDTVQLPVPDSDEGVDFPLIEESTSSYILDYIDNHMRPDQRWLFESRPGFHISPSYLTRVFNTYAKEIGLGPKYAWQSLRHGRGFRLWSILHDLSMVAKSLRCNIRSAARYATLDAEAEKEYRKTLNKLAFNPLRHRKVGGKSG